MPPVSARQDFKPAQQQALTLLREGRATILTRGGYEALCGVSRSQAAYDLAELVDAGLLERVGGGRTTRYVLVREPNSSRRHWTSERIRAELTHFCAGRSAWPSAREFKAVGRGDLYVAASRYGGIAFWAAELSLPRTNRWEAPSIPRLRLSVSWAIIGAVGGALGVGAAVAIVQGFPGGTPAPVAQHARSTAASNTPSVKKSQAKASRPRTRKAPAHAATAKAKAKAPHSTHQSQPVAHRSSGSGTAVLAARTVSSVSAPTASSPTSSSTSSSTPSRTTSSSSSSSGPTPMMAPRQTGSGTPPPLPPPSP